MGFLTRIDGVHAERVYDLIAGATYPHTNAKGRREIESGIKKRARVAAIVVDGRPPVLGGWDMLRRLSPGGKRKGKARG